MKKTSLWLSVFALIGGIYFSISWMFSSMILIAKREQADIDTIKHLTSEINRSSFILTNFDNQKYDIWVDRPVDKFNCAIIFSHGWGSSRIKLNSFEAVFNDYSCLHIKYDIRGHATHPGKYSSGGILEAQDLLQIHTFVQNQYDLKESQIAWLGVSLGGSFSLIAANWATPAFIVADSPFIDWRSAIFERGEELYGSWVHIFEPGIRAVIYLRAGFDYRNASVINDKTSINSPTLLIHSASDSETSPQQSRDIYAQLKSNAIRLKITDWGSDHAKDARDQPEKYKELIQQFIGNKAPNFGKGDSH